jgi:hypothetical protein
MGFRLVEKAGWLWLGKRFARTYGKVIRQDQTLGAMKHPFPGGNHQWDRVSAVYAYGGSLGQNVQMTKSPAEMRTSRPHTICMCAHESSIPSYTVTSPPPILPRCRF